MNNSGYLKSSHKAVAEDIALMQYRYCVRILKLYTYIQLPIELLIGKYYDCYIVLDTLAIRMVE